MILRKFRCTVNIDRLIQLYYLLPERIKNHITIHDIDELYSSVNDAVLDNPKILSFTNKNNAEFYNQQRGHDLIISGKDIIGFQIAISLSKAADIWHDLGDDEDEIIVLNPIVNKKNIIDIIRKNNTKKKKRDLVHNVYYRIKRDYEKITDVFYPAIKLSEDHNIRFQQAIIITFLKDYLFDDNDYYRWQREISKLDLNDDLKKTIGDFKKQVLNFIKEKNEKLKNKLNDLEFQIKKTGNDITFYINFKNKMLKSIDVFNKKYGL